MKCVFLLAAVVIVASTWARPARAQLGLLNLGTGTGMGTQLDNQKNLVKKKQKTSLPPPPVAGSTRAHSSRSARSLLVWMIIGLAGSTWRASPLPGTRPSGASCSAPMRHTSREGGPTAKGEDRDTARPCTRHKNRRPGLVPAQHDLNKVGPCHRDESVKRPLQSGIYASADSTRKQGGRTSNSDSATPKSGAASPAPLEPPNSPD